MEFCQHNGNNEITLHYTYGILLTEIAEFLNCNEIPLM